MTTYKFSFGNLHVETEDYVFHRTNSSYSVVLSPRVTKQIGSEKTMAIAKKMFDIVQEIIEADKKNATLSLLTYHIIQVRLQDFIQKEKSTGEFPSIDNKDLT